ncbi:hypothetical protein MYCTH_2312351 [Thermothelomyces thermophilus ATCC 42464]|uniref:Uncharacterized protein n=1 Tax=Thermothelomyces thermophilus (strain ATCC 42464 / BCRC 31852 / DSM 1799) TaxID=573729 RepID=G2QQC7_THET4|nr:uncharacterized protein MYCTH_2312351 [Thermothelomyces thermophilus ATCC 42464]AEO61790.1 hypothetical protein MYCTH_2312351 [Thermothelomyces thermophilus ATCC 42464]
MSHRSSDVYSRRPFGDDRRVPESRDHRRESLQRVGSDSSRADRYRKDSDTSARDSLRNQSDISSLGTPSLSPTVKPHLVRSSRSENGIKISASASQSSAESPSPGSTLSTRLISLLKQHDAAVIEVARLRAERDPLEKVWKKRQEEYEKSKIKHAEFPSVPEVQNLHRVKYGERLRYLDAEIRKAQDIVDETGRSIALAVSGCSEPTVPLQPQEPSKSRLAEISELRSELRKIKAGRLQERSGFEAELERRFAELKEQLTKQFTKQLSEQREKIVTGLSEMKEIKAMRSMKEETVEEVEQQLRAAREELDKRLSDGLEAVTSAKASTLAQKEMSALRTDYSGLLKRVDDLTQQLSRNAQDTIYLRGELTEQLAQSNRRIASLSKDLSACVQRVEVEARKVEEHEEKLSGLDAEALEGVAEKMSIEFPDLQRKMAGIQAKMDGTISRQEVESKQNSLLARVQRYVTESGESLAQMVDAVQKATAEQSVQIEELKKASISTARVGADSEPNQATKAEFETISSDIASIKSEFDATRMTVDKLSKDVSIIIDEDLKNQLEMVRLSIKVLDSQFSNLSTKSLAEHIIGQLGQIYPNAQQINADIEALKTMISNLAYRMVQLERQTEDLRRAQIMSCSCRAKTCAPETNSFDMLKVSNMQDSNLRNLNDNAQPVLKRRRTDSVLNADEHLLAVPNGTNQTGG